MDISPDPNNIPSSGTLTSTADQAVGGREAPTAQTAQSQTTIPENASGGNRTSRKAKKKDRKSKKKLKKKLNKISKKLLRVPVNENLNEAVNVTPKSVSDPDSSKVISSPDIAKSNVAAVLARTVNGAMGIEDSEHIHGLLHTLLFGGEGHNLRYPDGASSTPGGASPALEHIPHKEQTLGGTEQTPGQEHMQNNSTRVLLNVGDTTTVITSGLTPETLKSTESPPTTETHEDDPEPVVDTFTGVVSTEGPNTTSAVSTMLEDPPQEQSPEHDHQNEESLPGQDPAGEDPLPGHDNGGEGPFPGHDNGGEELRPGGDPGGEETELPSISKESEMGNKTENGMAGATLEEEEEDDEEGAKQKVTIHVHRKDRDKSRSLRKLWKRQCKRDYYNLPVGRQCCIRTVRCFDHIPELIDEIETFEENHVSRELVCSHVRDSLTCMSTTLQQKECRKTAKAINNKFKPQLSAITNFFDPQCLTTEAETTTRPAEGQGQRGSTGGAGHVNAGIIGATVGGFILVGVVILIILLIRRRKPKRGHAEKVTHDNSVNDGNASSRYKDMEFHRRRSEVYAEIDESSMHTFRNADSNGYIEPGDVRRLPTAPAGEPGTEDHLGYLTPQVRKESGAEETACGYTTLQSDEGTVSYTTLHPAQPDDDADYVCPDEDPNSPRRRSAPGSQIGLKTRQPSTGEEPYHAYFVLEKENIEHV